MIRLRTQKLLSGVSALAALMTFGAAGAQAAGTTVSGPGAKDAINTLTDTTAGTRDFVRIDTNADVGVDGSGRSFYNPRTIPGLILIGGATTGLRIVNSTLEGSIENGGVILSTTTDAVKITTSNIVGGFKNTGSILSLSGQDGIQITDSTFSGGIQNTLDGEIRAIDTGINIRSNTSFSGGITNAGLIASTTLGSGTSTTGFGDGINIHSGVIFTGGIVNTFNGEILGGGATTNNFAIRVNADSFSGGISNSGLSQGQGTTAGAILIAGDVFQGGITNEATGVIAFTGTIGIGNAIDIQGGSFEGGIVNKGLIDARVNSAHAISISGNEFTGGISNSGSILSNSSTTIVVSGLEFAGGIQNSGSIVSSSDTAISISGGSFAGGIHNEQGGLIQGLNDAINVSAASFTGGITNAGSITSTGSSNAIDINGASFAGGILNSGSIIAGSSSAAISISSANYAGGISNSGLIQGGSTDGAIDIGAASFTGGISNSGSIIGDGANAIDFYAGTFAGGITNEVGGLINSHGNAIELAGATFTDGILNAGMIGGGTSGDANIAIHVATAFSGGITNQDTGTIEGSTHAISINGSSFAGGIHNAGLIDSTNAGVGKTAILFSGGSFAGGISNSGTILADRTDISITGASFSGGISNGGLIESRSVLNGDAISFAGGSFSDGISNSGTILGGNHAISLSGASFDGGVTNDGLVQTKGAGASAILITTSTFAGGIVNNSHGTIQAGQASGSADAVQVSAANFSGGIINHGLIQGGASSGLGVDISAGTTFSGGISNTGTIQAASTALRIASNNFSGGLHNDGGTIRSQDSGYGVEITGTTFTGGVTNSGLIEGNPGVNPGTGLFITSHTFSGGINNSGTIKGDDPGLVVTSANFSGGVSNSGLIEGTGISADGANLSGTTFTGGFVNSGTITGDDIGVDINYTSSFTGGFQNSGSIFGVAEGVRIGGNNVTGGVSNSGTIDASDGIGVLLSMNLLNGNVSNSGNITASTDGLNIALGTTVHGDVVNSGTISSDSQDAIDVNDLIQGTLSNSGLLVGGETGNGIDFDGSATGGIVNSGTIIGGGQGAIDMTSEDAPTTLTQTAGLISDNRTGAYAINMFNFNDDTFYANGGRVQGDIEAGGEGPEDDMITQTGTFTWEYGSTDGTQFKNFKVEADGTSILGATERGDAGGEGVSVSTVSAAFDGHVYLDDDTRITTDKLGTFTQGSAGTIEYFLTADDALNGSDAHAIINVGATIDGGLQGKVAVYLDASSFKDAALNGISDFEYDGVVRSHGAVGPSDLFANAANIETNSLFFTGVAVEDGNNIDINLTRLDFADVLNSDGETENQNAVGGALDQIVANIADGGETSASFDQLLEALYGSDLTAPEIQAIYDELGGAEHAQLQNTALGLSGVLGTLIGDRLDSTLPGLGGGKMASLAWKQFADGTDGKTASDVTPPSSAGNRGLNTGASGASVWARGYGNWTKADGDTEATGYDQNTGGAALGVDFAVASNATLGLAGGWSTTDVSFDTAGDDATVDTYQGGLYGSVGMGRFYLDGSATYSAHDLSVTRLVDLPGPATPFEATSNYNASAWSLNGEFGSIFRVGRVDLQPSAALAYTSLSTDGFTESDANNPLNKLTLNVQGSDASSFASTLAVRGSGQFMMGRTRVMPDVKLGWRHDFGDDRQTFTAAFEQDRSVPFEIISSKTASDAAVVNAGITAAVTKSIEVFVDLNGQYSGEVTTSNAAGGVRLTW